METLTITTKKESDDEPVIYCTQCLSLNIRTVEDIDGEMDICASCGCSDLKWTDFESWDRMWISRYGKPLARRRVYKH